jgi:4-carboxymuconolactone decarboxylase
VHKREGLKAGLDPAVVAAIAARQEPILADDRERAVYAVARTLIGTTRLPQALHDQATAVLGERGLVELVALLGYYSMVALTLNAFEIGLPDAHAEELEARP